jgi:hypothetical protein
MAVGNTGSRYINNWHDYLKNNKVYMKGVPQVLMVIGIKFYFNNMLLKKFFFSYILKIPIPQCIFKLSPHRPVASQVEPIFLTSNILGSNTRIAT